jgi:competence protein ComEA
MSLNREPIGNWFGYTRRERRSAYILLVIIIILILIRFTVPERNADIECFGIDLKGTDSLTGVSDPVQPSATILFAFDPNTASYDTLIKLGFTDREASTLDKYRKSGGRFRVKSDIRKVYGIDSTKAEKLVHYVVVPSFHLEKKKSDGSFVQKDRLDINSCDSLSLVALPGIGAVLSARIIKYRTLLGGFARSEQLMEVYGLSAETYDMIKGRIYADSSPVRRVEINSAGYRELSRIPYLEKYDVSAILKYRELADTIKSIEDLKVNKILTPEKADKVEPYIDFR